MHWRVEISNRQGVFCPEQSQGSDSRGAGVAKDIVDLGISQVHSVEVIKVFNIFGDLSKADIEIISDNLLADKVSQQYRCLKAKPTQKKKSSHDHRIEITHNPGVMDPVEHSTLKGIKDLGVKTVEAVRTADQYLIHGDLTQKELDIIVEKVLSNKLIQHVVNPDKEEDVSYFEAKTDAEVLTVDLINASDKKLQQINQEGQLYLSLDEMKAVREHFQKLKRNPSDVELETIAQTWSEHCFHKTFRGNISYEYTKDGKTKTRKIRNLLKSTIAKATFKLDKDWCVSVFHDNAGVIKFDKDFHVCFKVETHNHPSALEPFGGANTGIGGVIRDILGTGLGAKPVCNTDVFCFAPPDTPLQDVPQGTLHPKRVMKGVVSGVRDYGNKMGIPTVNGSVYFDKDYVSNPLVYCGNVGIMPKNKVNKKVSPGDLIVAVGGKTGRDGIHGATFSSGELTEDSEVVSSGAVQIGNPIEEKKVLDALLKARDLNLYSAITDCGAGGFSSAVGEMGEKTGARVNLEEAPLKYEGLSYSEIWISESQERMVMAVPQKSIDEFLHVFADENVEASIIGEFTDSGKLELYFHGQQVCDLDMDFLHDGNPRVAKKAKWIEPKKKPLKLPQKIDLTTKLFDVLSHYNICSKEWIVRQYDHEVQGGSIIKPFVGPSCDGPSDASVIIPRLGSTKGIAVSNGINPQYGKIDPFWMAASCIDEAIRQVISVGGDPSRIAILDNFCWGNPDKPDRLGGLVRAAEGCYKAAVAYGTPFISGKDSLYNEYTQGKRSIAIPGTLLISAIGIVPDIRKALTMDFKKPGNLVYIVGETMNELGGSVYLDTLDQLGSDVPKPNFKKALKTFNALHTAIKKRLVRSSHDCSDGGLITALAEMAFSGGLGVTALLNRVPYKGKVKSDDILCFSESNSRFIVEVEPKKQKQFEEVMQGIKFAEFGLVEETSNITVFGSKGKPVLTADINELKSAWKAPLDF